MAESNWGDEPPALREELLAQFQQLEHLPPVEKARLSLGIWVPFGCAVLLVLSGIAFYFDGDNLQRGEIIFERAVNVLPPIVTMILGYYFGSEKSK